MKTYKFITTLLCFVLLIACRDAESQRDNNETNQFDNEEFSPVDRNIPRDKVDDEQRRSTNEDDTSRERTTTPGQTKENRETVTSSAVMAGQYIKTGQENDNSCNCYCIDLSATNPELCLVNNELYISTRFQKKLNNSIDVFLVNPSTRNSQGKEIPWKDFDRNAPIATITPKSNGELEFDWLGFTINGDLAVDYAIYGKKTLEGTFKKK
ncbi:hypothetical protein BH23BAC2_BH23BAC2_08730 [soil metagenome]